ncbi:PREDICTED: agamous-like MADS-box protein AGL18 isoform X1 [Camelina sativa]|uniref:Agamous-like MADS-box protein AGL18 isoform X1 n=1 Tax=Camelina sativa TaxID=90675 RepID=A0ABM0Z9I8_CAMSA|nr:PREDICTED: agamous-like MADS-box protein AGL18 isoform X1 [Camelina sativa]
MSNSSVNRTTKATQLSNSGKRIDEKEDSESLLRTAETLKGELESLQLLNERLHGESLYGLSFHELGSLAEQLKQGRLNVEDELQARLLNDPEGDDLDNYDDKEKIHIELVLQGRLRDLRKQDRELRSSSSDGERLEEHDGDALQLPNIEYLRSKICF